MVSRLPDSSLKRRGNFHCHEPVGGERLSRGHDAVESYLPQDGQLTIAERNWALQNTHEWYGTSVAICNLIDNRRSGVQVTPPAPKPVEIQGFYGFYNFFYKSISIDI